MHWTMCVQEMMHPRHAMASEMAFEKSGIDHRNVYLLKTSLAQLTVMNQQNRAAI